VKGLFWCSHVECYPLRREDIPTAIARLGVSSVGKALINQSGEKSQGVDRESDHNLASKAAVGLADTISSRDLPVFLRTAIFPDGDVSISRTFWQLGFVAEWMTSNGMMNCLNW